MRYLCRYNDIRAVHVVVDHIYSEIACEAGARGFAGRGFAGAKEAKERLLL